MGVAIYTLEASLRKGRYSEHLQWDSMHKTATWYNNAYAAGIGYDNATMLAKENKKMFVTHSPQEENGLPDSFAAPS